MLESEDRTDANLHQDAADQPQPEVVDVSDAGSGEAETPAEPVVRKTTRKRSTRKAPAKKASAPAPDDPSQSAAGDVSTSTDLPETADQPDNAGQAGSDDDAGQGEPGQGETAAKPTRKRAAKKAAAKPRKAKSPESPSEATVAAAGSGAATVAESGAVDEATPGAPGAPEAQTPEPEDATGVAAKPKRSRAKTTRTRKTAAPAESEPDATAGTEASVPESAPDESPSESTADAAGSSEESASKTKHRPAVGHVLFQVPERGAAAAGAEDVDDVDDAGDAEDEAVDAGDGESGEDGEASIGRRRRRRGGRRRRKSGGDTGGDSADDSDSTPDAGSAQTAEDGPDASDEAPEGETTSRRRRRRRRAGEEGDGGGDDPRNTVTRVRRARSVEDEITAVSGSTRLEAKKQRRREGREAGRRRAPIVSEAEFLARRESVERVMAIRQREDVTQIAVLEDKVLVEHYVARESQTSLIGNIYLGRVQNVLPSMEAAFIDIGKGRNAVLYAGEVNWSALGHPEGQPRKIESVLSSGQAVMVQVTKDPVGQKGARLTSQISLAGRFLVYVPDGTTSGISRKLPDTERARLRSVLREIVPDTAGVIVRTAAEGAAEDELTRDVERLKARWEDVEKKASKGNSPQLLYGEPDLTLKVVRDLFTEDFAKLVIQGDDAWETVHGYIEHVAPDLADRVERYDVSDAVNGGRDLFSQLRIEEQIHKGLDRKVWLPSGGSLIIDRTEAMTVVDVNTGKFTGSGGNLEETVTKNNLEAAEEIVRQLRLRDIGGIIVVDFIDMVLESNRDLVLRRLVECLGRDRTRHQVAEVTSLGLVQMTRKRIGTGLLEAFSESCPHCAGRGVLVAEAPVEPKRSASDDSNSRGSRRSRGGRGRTGDDSEPAPRSAGNGGGNSNGNGAGNGARPAMPSPADVAAMTKAAPEADAAPEGDAEASGNTEPTSGASNTQPPAVVDAPEEREGPATEPTAGEQAESETQQAESQTQVDAGEEVVAETEPPRAPVVVKRTRRRAASRPAGPPNSEVVAADAAPSEEQSPESAVRGEAPLAGEAEPDESADGSAPAFDHVPVKRRGRKR